MLHGEQKVPVNPFFVQRRGRWRKHHWYHGTNWIQKIHFFIADFKNMLIYICLCFGASVCVDCIDGERLWWRKHLAAHVSNFSWICFQSSVNYELAPRRYCICHLKWMATHTHPQIDNLSSDLPYLICAISPTTMSDTGSCMTWLPRTTWNFCSCSMRLCSPRNCFSFDQSLKAVTSTTHTTDNRIAAPSIQPASASPSSSTPPATMPHATVWWQLQEGEEENCRDVIHLQTHSVFPQAHRLKYCIDTH